MIGGKDTNSLQTSDGETNAVIQEQIRQRGARQPSQQLAVKEHEVELSAATLWATAGGLMLHTDEPFMLTFQTPY